MDNFTVLYPFILSVAMIVYGVMALRKRQFSIALGIGRFGGSGSGQFRLEGRAGTVAVTYCIAMGLILLLIAFLTIFADLMPEEHLWSISIAMGFLTLFGILIGGTLYKIYVATVTYEASLKESSKTHDP